MVELEFHILRREVRMCVDMTLNQRQDLLGTFFTSGR
jgi:hypothetical protein